MFEFEIIDNKLVAIFFPNFGIEEILKKIKKEGHCIKNTFWVEKNNLIENINTDEEYIAFAIGKKQNEIIKLDKNVMRTNNDFYFPKDFDFKKTTFIATYNISIIHRIDLMIKHDLYIGVENKENYIPVEMFNNLIKLFPNRNELSKYSEKRIAIILKEKLINLDKYEFIYENYLSKKENRIQNNDIDSKSKLKIAYEQFSIAIDTLEYMLENENYYSESVWQAKIYDIIQLLYPKYIYYEREVRFNGIDSHDKRLDFILVDANGFIDVLEIKKPDTSILSKNITYRNNYVPVRELSGTVQQVEKYIYCLNNLNSNDNFFKKVEEKIPNGIKVKVLNPNGMIIMGRNNTFNEQQNQDFELIKRQYKNITEIMTYDDLLLRLKTITSALIKRI